MSRIITDTDNWLTVYLLFWLAVLGAVIGSFADCAAWRYLSGESLIRGRSHCGRCGHVLTAADLIPVCSYLLRRGRCRYCGEKIPGDCLVAEVLTMAVFPALGWKFGIGGELIMWLILAVILLISGLIDWQAKLLPDGLLLGAVVNRVIFLFLLAQPLKETLLHMAAGAISVSLPLLLLTLLMDHLLGRETMGGGDIKLLFVLGLYMDWMEMVLILLIGCVLALIRGLWQKRKSLQDSIAFGPFLAAGWLLVLFGGAPLIDWYCALLI